MIKRLVEKQIRSDLFKGKTVILYGARQVGKTTLVQEIVKGFGTDAKYLNCEILSVEQNLQDPEPERLKTFFGSYKLLVLDEAQNIPNIGKILKVATDSLKDIQIIATGSSSFDLANKTSEPMTGRVFHHTLYPLSIMELLGEKAKLDIEPEIEKLLRFGSYPNVYEAGNDDAAELLFELSSSYLFKDLLRFDGIKKSTLLKNLVVSLALQVGNQVSYSELAVKLGVTSATVQKYIDLLEQSFIVFRLHSFSRNLRKELSKSFKVYFWDTGIRNAIINNFNLLSMRTDTGALWENFCIAERMKANAYSRRRVNAYFWRTYDQKEIDYVEETGGAITGYEFKFSEKQKVKPCTDFMETYNAQVFKIDRTTFWKFVELTV